MTDPGPAGRSRVKARLQGFLCLVLVVGPVFAGAFAKSQVKGMSVKDGFLISLGGIGFILAITAVILLFKRYSGNE